MKRIKFTQGFSLVEMIIVISVFSILAVVVTQSLTLSLRGAQKGRAVGSVRENLEFAISVMERQLRNAKSLNCAESNHNTLVYVDSYGNNARFACVTQGVQTYIASGSASLTRLTNSSVNVVNCNDTSTTERIFSCTQGSGSPDSVIIKIRASDASGVGQAEGSSETFTTQISLRNY
ncbi:MAG: type II secretion system GspH family protein [Patescibacteria group bacterium]|nr:type II secretion system GspH family protein [Patescibacteria group bacterium]